MCLPAVCCCWHVWRLLPVRPIAGEEVQYVKIGQNLCSFLAEGNQPLEIDVKASPAEWTVEMGASWVKAERTDDRTLTVTVDDNDTGAERSAVLQ